MAVEAIIISSDAAYIGIGKPTKYLYVCNGKIPGTCATLYIFHETRIEQSLYEILMINGCEFINYDHGFPIWLYIFIPVHVY